MRTRLLLLAVMLVAVAATLLWRRSNPGGHPEARVVTPPSPAPPVAVAERGSASRSVAPNASAELTPPSFDEGRIEVKVKSTRGPIAGAQVFAYLRGPRDPNTSLSDWRSVGSGLTDRDGVTRFPTRPGRYLVSARASGFGSARREVTRPEGEQTTVVELGLQKGANLSGRTVTRRGQEAVPLVEVVLTFDVTGKTWCRRPEAPAEEREYATSDATGRFRFEGLAAVSYCVQARVAGFARWMPLSVAFPFPHELVLELVPAGVIEGFVVAADGKAAAGATVGGLAPTALLTDPRPCSGSPSS